MTIGFRIRNSSGQLLLSSDNIGLLFLDQFTLASGSITRSYLGMAGAIVNVVQLGANSIGSNPVMSVNNSGPDKVVTVTVEQPGYFIVTRE